MSLLNSFARPYTLLRPAAEGDAEGGGAVSWTEGPRLTVALDSPRQSPQVLAGAERLALTRSALFAQGAPVEPGVYLRPEGAGEVYRVRTRPVPAPGVSCLGLCQAEVEQTELPT